MTQTPIKENQENQELIQLTVNLKMYRQANPSKNLIGNLEDNS